MLSNVIDADYAVFLTLPIRAVLHCNWAQVHSAGSEWRRLIAENSNLLGAERFDLAWKQRTSGLIGIQGISALERRSRNFHRNANHIWL